MILGVIVIITLFTLRVIQLSGYSWDDTDIKYAKMIIGAWFAAVLFLAMVYIIDLNMTNAMIRETNTYIASLIE